jgi:hypothetical protein
MTVEYLGSSIQATDVGQGCLEEARDTSETDTVAKTKTTTTTTTKL